MLKNVSLLILPATLRSIAPATQHRTLQHFIFWCVIPLLCPSLSTVYWHKKVRTLCFFKSPYAPSPPHFNVYICLTLSKISFFVAAGVFTIHLLVTSLTFHYCLEFHVNFIWISQKLFYISWFNLISVWLGSMLLYVLLLFL